MWRSLLLPRHQRRTMRPGEGSVSLLRIRDLSDPSSQPITLPRVTVCSKLHTL